MPSNQQESVQPQINRIFQTYLLACEEGEAKTVSMVLEHNPGFVSKLSEKGDTGLMKAIANSQSLGDKSTLEIVEAHLKVSSGRDLTALSKASDLARSICGPNSSITLALDRRISTLKPKRTTI